MTIMWLNKCAINTLGQEAVSQWQWQCEWQCEWEWVWLGQGLHS